MVALWVGFIMPVFGVVLLGSGAQILLYSVLNKVPPIVPPKLAVMLIITGIFIITIDLWLVLVG